MRSMNCNICKEEIKDFYWDISSFRHQMNNEHSIKGHGKATDICDNCYNKLFAPMFEKLS